MERGSTMTELLRQVMESGAGEEGTDEVVKNYKKQTPGQSEGEYDGPQQQNLIPEVSPFTGDAMEDVVKEEDDEGWYAHREMHGSKGVSRQDWKKGVRMNSKGQHVNINKPKVKKEEADLDEGGMKRSMDKDPVSGKVPMDTFKKKPSGKKDIVKVNPAMDEAAPKKMKKLARQFKDPKKEMMVHHPKTGVKVIDKKDWGMHKAAGYNPAEEFHLEGYELDELSRKTLGSYISKASDARGHRKLPIKKVDNRYTGVAKASDKLDKMEKSGMKEENEDTNDVLRGSLEPGGTFKHRWFEEPVDLDEKSIEDIVKGMKRDEDGFKKRYGDRYKDVMYATANKLAKEQLELEEKKKKLDKVDHDELKGDHDDREDGDIDNDGDEDKSDKYLHNRRKKVKKEIDQQDTEEGVMGTGYTLGRNVTKAAGHVGMGVAKAAVRKGERTKNVVKGVKKAVKQVAGNNRQRVFTKESENEGYVGGAIGGAIGLAHGAPIAGAKIGSTVGDIAAIGAAAYAAHKVYKVGKKMVKGGSAVARGAKKAGSTSHKIFKKVQNKHIQTKKGKELHNSFDWDMEVIMTEEQHAEMEESMSIHVTPHKNGTHYTVKKVGSAMKKHGGIKKGEHLSDTEIDDAGESGIKVHHEEIQQDEDYGAHQDAIAHAKKDGVNTKKAGSMQPYSDHHMKKRGYTHRVGTTYKKGKDHTNSGTPLKSIGEAETAADKYAAFISSQNVQVKSKDNDIIDEDMIWDLDLIAEMSEAEFDEILDTMTDEELKELEEGLLGAIGRGIKKVAVGGAKLAAKGGKALAHRVSTQGRIDHQVKKQARIQGKIDKVQRKTADREKLAKLKSGTAKLGSSLNKAKSADASKKQELKRTSALPAQHEETSADKYAAFMSAQNKEMSPSNAKTSITVKSKD